MKQRCLNKTDTSNYKKEGGRITLVRNQPDSIHFLQNLKRKPVTKSSWWGGFFWCVEVKSNHTQMLEILLRAWQSKLVRKYFRLCTLPQVTTMKINYHLMLNNYMSQSFISLLCELIRFWRDLLNTFRISAEKAVTVAEPSDVAERGKVITKIEILLIHCHLARLLTFKIQPVFKIGI